MFPEEPHHAALPAVVAVDEATGSGVGALRGGGLPSLALEEVTTYTFSRPCACGGKGGVVGGGVNKTHAPEGEASNDRAQRECTKPVPCPSPSASARPMPALPPPWGKPPRPSGARPAFVVHRRKVAVAVPVLVSHRHGNGRHLVQEELQVHARQLADRAHRLPLLLRRRDAERGARSALRQEVLPPAGLPEREGVPGRGEEGRNKATAIGVIRIAVCRP